MRIGLYGGAFDPIHNGHVSVIRGVLDSGLADIVIVIPSARNPFKPGRSLTCAPYRYYMVKDVIEDLFSDKVFVSDIEFWIEGLSYTDSIVDKVTDTSYMTRFLMDCGFSAKKAGSSHDYFWIAGSDSLKTLYSWHNAGSLVSKIDFLMAIRPGDNISSEDVIRLNRDKLGLPVNITTFDIDGINIASSGIRASANFDEVPEKAMEFINQHDLYNAQQILADASEETCKHFVEVGIWMYGHLKKKRLLHTLNTGLLSAYLAKCHGGDIDKALIAGAVHDCAKELPVEEQAKLARIRSGNLFTEEKLLHSPAGAVFYADAFDVDDTEILDAITYHTTGRGDMTLLDKIVFLADKIEPSRTYTDLSLMRKLAPSDLDGAAKLCLESVVDKFRKKGRPVHPLTEDFMKSLGMN